MSPQTDTHDLPPELFGVPGTPGEWLSPEDEQATLARLDAITEAQTTTGQTTIPDTAWLTITCRNLLRARIATRAAVIANAQQVRDLEQGQRVLTGILHITTL